MPRGEHRLFGRFLHSNVGKLQLKIVSAQVVPSQVTHITTWRKFEKSSTKTAKVPFWKSLAGYASHMEHQRILTGDLNM
jgi:hypothetical protein